VKRWDLRSLAPSSKKRRAREPGADAPRVPRAGRQMPRVLFSSPECRAVVIDLQSGEELGDHQIIGREGASVSPILREHRVLAGRPLIMLDARGDEFIGKLDLYVHCGTVRTRIKLRSRISR